MNISIFKSTYGYIGFVPFALFCLVPWIAGSEFSKIAITFQLGYGAIIITFLAGMSWGWRDNQRNQKFNLSMGILFSLFGCSILLLTYFNYILVALLLSVISFQFFYYFEQSTEDFLLRDDDYKKFRKMFPYLYQ